MAILKCKMCGGDLNVTEENKFAECEFCGTKQTILTPDNEKKTNLYNRANRLRFANEFDKAAAVFESLVAEFSEEAEAYWGLCLCKYGIEYVDDPKTGKKIPTCHRTSYESIFDDDNFDIALEYADSVAQSIYREEAKNIDRIQKGILEIASKEKPFDIFICYKETDDKGERTVDSVLAQDIYDKLTEKGYKVFFSRITLEDKLGQEYEPYIFSALNSAKIMLAIGTSYEYYNAVWVKNEWNRFLDIMKNNKNKTLIPCYKDIDAYDMPKEFRNLQGQDMGKLGFLQDLIRGIDKILGNNKEKLSTTNISSANTSSNSGSMTERGQIYLEDGEFDSAIKYFDDALNNNPKDSDAYFGKFMALLKISDVEELKNQLIKLDQFKDFERALRFAAGSKKQQLLEVKNSIENNIFVQKEKEMLDEKEKIYNDTIKLIESDKNEDLKKAKEQFLNLGDFKDSKEKAEFCNNKIVKHECFIENLYNEAVELYNSGNYKEATIKFFKCENIKNTSVYLRKMLKHNIAIACGDNNTVALKSDGTVVVVGNNDYRQCNVEDWKNIISVTGGIDHTVGLKSDGTVVVVGDNEFGQCDVEDWKDIVSIACGSYHTVGLKSDGTVIAVGDNEFGQCDVEDWEDIDHFANLKDFLNQKENIKKYKDIVKREIEELEKLLSDKNEDKIRLTKQIADFDSNIEKKEKEFEALGMALFGKKAAIKKELQENIYSIRKNRYEQLMELRKTETDISDLQNKIKDKQDLL